MKPIIDTSSPSLKLNSVGMENVKVKVYFIISLLIMIELTGVQHCEIVHFDFGRTAEKALVRNAQVRKKLQREVPGGREERRGKCHNYRILSSNFQDDNKYFTIHL